MNKAKFFILSVCILGVYNYHEIVASAAQHQQHHSQPTQHYATQPIRPVTQSTVRPKSSENHNQSHPMASHSQINHSSSQQEDKKLKQLCEDFVKEAKDLAENQKGQQELRKKMGTKKYKEMLEKAFESYKKMFDYTKQNKKSAVDQETYKHVKHAAKKLFESKNIKNMVLRLRSTASHKTSPATSHPQPQNHTAQAKPQATAQ